MQVRRWICLWCVFSLFLAACSRVSDHVVLLPGPDDRTGVLSITTARGEAVLAEPYTAVDVAGGQLSRLKTSPRMVRDAYGRLLDMQPARPRLLVFYFATGSNALTPESQSRLAEVRDDLASLPAGEAIVIGHTDRVGGTEANDQLSLRRAELVRDLLVAAGVAPAAIVVVGRGEREPAVLPADEVAKPQPPCRNQASSSL